MGSRISYSVRRNHPFAVYAEVGISVTIPCQAGLACFTPLLGGPASFLTLLPGCAGGLLCELRLNGVLGSSRLSGSSLLRVPPSARESLLESLRSTEK